jgi:fucose 4-O-acetylase-like acetyltransferase
MSKDQSMRLGSFDVLKGFIIFAIVMLHLIFTNKDTVGDQAVTETALVLQIVYIGLMSFFVISGYFYRPDRGFMHNISSRVKQLVIAIAICTVVLTGILFVWEYAFGTNAGLDGILTSFQYGFGLNKAFMDPSTTIPFPICGPEVGYYFLWAMMMAFIIFYGLADYVMKDAWKVIATVVALLVIACVWTQFVNVRLPFFIDLAPMGAALMFAGAWLAKLDLGGTIERFEFRTKGFWLPLLICLVCGVVLCFFFHPDIKFDEEIYGAYGGYSVFPYFLEAVFMVVVYLYLAKFLSIIPLLGKALAKVGKHTLGILLLHGFVAKMIITPVWPITDLSWFPSMPMGARVAIGFATLIICVLICHFGPKVVANLRKGKKEENPQ